MSCNEELSLIEHARIQDTARVHAKTIERSSMFALTVLVASSSLLNNYVSFSSSKRLHLVGYMYNSATHPASLTCHPLNHKKSTYLTAWTKSFNLVSVTKPF